MDVLFLSQMIELITETINLKPLTLCMMSTNNYTKLMAKDKNMLTHNAPMNQIKIVISNLHAYYTE